MMRTVFGALVVIFILGSIGCGASKASLPDDPLAIQPVTSATHSAAPQQLAPAVLTAVSPEDKPAISVEESTRLAPTPLPDPLKFTFPTAGPQSISLWRPPLYPTPWQPTPRDHFLFTRPIGANAVNWPLAKYRYGYLLYSEPHTGVDIPTPVGTPVMAVGPGVVTFSGYGIYNKGNIYKDPYGIAVSIKHDFGFAGKTIYTVYGHLNETYVFRGQHVEGGEVIGTVGETGKVSGPHLHLEVRIGEETFFATRNPELWISPPQGWGVLVGRIIESDGDKLTKVKVKLRNLDANHSYEVLTYAQGSVNSDDYYNENLALGDLPAGRYMMYLDHPNISAKTELFIRPGQVTFFTFEVVRGFDFSLPPVKEMKFIPPDQIPLITDTSASPSP